MSLYQGKTMLAPMVRVGNVGFRIFCAAQGADVVFSEEVVAAKLRRCHREVRVYDEEVGPMVEFVAYEPFKDGYKRCVAFSTPERTNFNPAGEGAPVVLQLGVSCPEIGTAAALLCCEDVDGIDVNMGCPKKFSVGCGMGAALMKDVVRAASILAAINDAVNAPARVVARGRCVPISFKTRLLETSEATVQMLTSILEKAGPNCVHAIILHARTTDQTSEMPPHYDRAAETVKLLRSHPLFSKICFVLNGSVTSRADGAAKMAKYGFDSVMIARHAMWDMTVFSSSQSPGASETSSSVFSASPLAATSWMDLYKDLLWCYVKYRIPFTYAKYHLTRCLPCITAMKHLMVTVQQEVNRYEDLVEIFDFPAERRELMRCAVTMEMVSRIPEGNSSSEKKPHVDSDAASSVCRRNVEALSDLRLKRSRME